MTMTEPEVLEPLALSRRHKVVLIDDEPAVLGSLRRLLRREPYDLLCTDRPEMALGWIEQRDVSLVMMDQRMPEMCGTELAERVRRCSPETIRVLLTAYPGNALVQHGLAEDVQWLISKPWSDDALRLTLRHLLHDREGRPPAAPLRAPATEPPDVRLLSWFRGKNGVLRMTGLAAKGLGWTLGFFGTTDAGGTLPR